MAIALDGVTSTETDTGAAAHTTTTTAHTPGAGSTIVIAIYQSSQGAGDNVVSGITWDGNAMTELGQISNTGDSATAIYYYANPVSGSSLNCIATHTNLRNTWLTVMTCTGSDTVMGALGTAEGTDNTAEDTITTTAANSWAITAACWHGNDVGAATHDQVQDWTGVSVGGGSSLGTVLCGGHEVMAAAGASAQVITVTNNDGWAMVGGELKIAASAGTNFQINIGDTWRAVPAMQINIGDAWKAVAGAQINIGDAWKTIY